MLRFFAIALFLLITVMQESAAQQLNPKVKWGKSFKAPRRATLADIVGVDGTGMYAVKRQMVRADYTLEHYNQELSPDKAFELDIRDDGQRCDIEEFLHIKGRLYMFYSYSGRDKKNVLKVQEIDKSTLMPKGKKVLVTEIDYAGHRRDRGAFQVRVSRDSSKILVLNLLPAGKNDPESYSLSVLDRDINRLWQKNVTLPYEDDLFDMASARVDNAGNVYLLGLIFKEKRKTKRRGEVNYSYKIFAYRDQGNTVKDYPVALEDRFLSDMQIEILNNRDIICAGFYSERSTSNVRGTYFITIDGATKEIKSKSFKDFDLNFITQNMTPRETRRARKAEERGGAELFSYDLDKLLIGKDGSAILIGEQYYVQTVTTTTGTGTMRQTTTTYHYYYNDIIVVKINPEGVIEWNVKVPKAQHTVNDGGFYSSYTMLIVKGNICFLFNDNPKNISYRPGDKMYNFNSYREAIVTLVQVDQSGKQTRQPLFGASDAEVLIRPKVCEQISGREVILFGQRKKKQQFARVYFE